MSHEQQWTGFTARAREIREQADRGEMIEPEDVLFLLNRIEWLLHRPVGRPPVVRAFEPRLVKSGEWGAF